MIEGFICERTGERLPFEACFECAKSRLNRKLDCPFDEAIIYGMISDQRHSESLSVTMICGCHRAIFIQRHYDYYVYPSQMYWCFRGQIAHKVLEEAKIHSDAITEERFVKQWEGIEVTGKPDIIVPSQKVLKDYKTAKQVPSYLNKDGQILAYDNHRVQVNLYRWLIAPEIPIEEMEIIYMSMHECLACPVEIWPDQTKKKTDMTVERYLEENLVPLKMALDSETMPPYERNWSCEEYCSVSDICYRELKKEISASRRVVKLKKGDKNVKDSTNKKRKAANSAA